MVDKKEIPELKSRWLFIDNGLEVKVLMITNVNALYGCDEVNVVFEVSCSGKPCSMTLSAWSRQMELLTDR